ncbi:MAG: cytochrome C [Bacteroidetes bacterium]|nr:cytochrome C [Bacteroidota bacterium]
MKYSHLFLIITLLLAVFLVMAFRSPGVQENTEKLSTEARLSPEDYPAYGSGCLASGCHAGIAPIREHDSKMAQDIYEKGKARGDMNGCVVCHKGDPETNDKLTAHKDMIRYPGSIWLEEGSCLQCHKDYYYNMHRNLMQTEAGKIQGALWGWGAQSGYDAIYGNYAIDDTNGLTPDVGTETYKSYMQKMREHFPGNFPKELQLLPEADISSIAEHPEQGVFTYLRSECLRCHVGVRGKQGRGDYHGDGCAACHIPFGDEGLYEGLDPSIPDDEPGHMLVHSIQSSRKAKLQINGKTWSGIPSETCSSCHNRGKRIGVSFLGLIESPYDTPWQADGSGQPKLHGKRYQFVRDDHHHSPESRDGNPYGGLLCQDCHTTIAMHGNGNIGGTTLGEVEVECSDCHGTPDNYPWELPIGYNDEFGLSTEAEARGLSTELLPEQLTFSSLYPPIDGYLFSARGNPFGNVVREGNAVIVHSAGGLDFRVPVLKKIRGEDAWTTPVKAKTAMINVGSHMDKMECYACHSTWAPQCYGCHVKIDYSNNFSSTDWLKTGEAHFPNGETSQTCPGKGGTRKLAGKATEGRTYIRWEDPILGVNGEGRIGPIITGCQQITTVIGPDGSMLVNNKIWHTPPYMENSGAEGQRGIDMSPAQPHTSSREARECTSCHANPKTLGYGISDGKYMQGYGSARYLDLQDNEGNVLSRNAIAQFNSIGGLDFDLSKVISRDGQQLQTVGHHWPLSGPLSQLSRDKMERAGVCMACHQDIPNGNIPIKMLVKAGKMLDMVPLTDEDHSELLNDDLRWSALTKVGIPACCILVILIIVYVVRRRRIKRK